MVILSRLVGELKNEGEHGGDDDVEDCGEVDNGDDKVVDESREGNDERDSDEDETDGGRDREEEEESDISSNFLLFIPLFSLTSLSSPNT